MGNAVSDGVGTEEERELEDLLILYQQNAII